MDKVYEFWYMENIFEGAPECISLHRTKKGAEVAMAYHKEEVKRITIALMGDNWDWDFGKEWGVREREVEE